MRLILQRVTRADVCVGDRKVAGIGSGLLVLAGVEKGDGMDQVERAAAKLSTLRVFEDDRGRMNLDAAETGAQFLVVSQFTLAGSLDKGRRPSFDRAAPPEIAAPLVESLVDQLRASGLRVETGEFGARMSVELVNDGPVTFVFDT